jgi:hypothetical protein
MRAARTIPSLCIPWLMFMTACPASSSEPVTIPANCENGQILVQKLGQWECGAPPKLTTPSPATGCLEKDGTAINGLVLTTGSGYLHCERLDLDVGSRLEGTKRSFDVALTQTSFYDPDKRQPANRYLGVTRAVSTGLMKASGVDNGLQAGAAICAAEYAGSHLCSMLEIYDSISQGVVTKDTRIPKSWIYFPANNASAMAQQPTEGLADSCAGYTYERDDRGWSGIAVEWTVLATSWLGLKFYGGSSAACSSMLPLTCCGGAP